MEPKEPATRSDTGAVATERWEHGSEFHWPTFEPEPSPPAPWHEGSLWNSGRDALGALIAHRGWQRLWIPSYFCQDVVRAIQTNGIETSVYTDAPDEAPPCTRLPAAAAGEAILVVNYFGLRPPPGDPYAGGAEIVEDHSHDPLSVWAHDSRADWCIASLRKSMPLPAGGAVWSPRRRSVPEAGQPSDEAERQASRKLAAMLLKTLFLDGHGTPKETFRALATAAESALGTGPPSAPPSWLPSLLAALPVRRWRQQRRPNFEVLANALEPLAGVEVLSLPAAAEAPFCVFLSFADAERAATVRQGLIERRIYPARLWDLDSPAISGVPTRHAELARRSLALHCDQRYGGTDMRRVAEAVAELCR